MKNRGLLLDRDGVVNVDRGYVGRREQFEFMPGLFPFLRAAQNGGYRLAILTNQSGVARGFYSIADFENLTSWMLKELAQQGIVIDLVLACFEHAEGTVAPFRRESYWRKPNPGMVCEAVQRLNLDPTCSAFLGDQPWDMKAAEAGCITKRMLLGKHAEIPDGVIAVAGFDEAITALDLNPFV